MAGSSTSFKAKHIEPGTKFHKWKVLQEMPRDAKNHRVWRCRCDCGTIQNVKQAYLGRSKGCMTCRDAEVYSRTGKVRRQRERRAVEVLGKECRECIERKPLTEFSRNGSGYYSICKACDSAKSAREYQEKKAAGLIPVIERKGLVGEQRGQVYNRITVIRQLDSVPRTRRDGRVKQERFVWAQCHCGTEFRVVLASLRSGNTKSCGCGSQRGGPRPSQVKEAKPPWAR